MAGKYDLELPARENKGFPIQPPMSTALALAINAIYI